MEEAEFFNLLSSFSSETPLGRVVQIRAEDDKTTLKNFSKDQHRIRNEWRNKFLEDNNNNEILEQEGIDAITSIFKNLAK